MLFGSAKSIFGSEAMELGGVRVAALSWVAGIKTDRGTPIVRQGGGFITNRPTPVKVSVYPTDGVVKTGLIEVLRDGVVIAALDTTIEGSTATALWPSGQPIDTKAVYKVRGTVQVNPTLHPEAQLRPYVPVNLGIPGLDEEYMPVPNEENPGGALGVNNDDDDKNLVPDLEQTSEVPGEDDLLKVTIFLDPLATDRGLVTLSVASGKDNVRVWADPLKKQLLVPQLPWSWATPDEIPPKVAYLEGLKASEREGDTVLRVIYNNQLREETYADQVVLTVYGVDLDIDSDNSNGYEPPARSTDEDKIEAAVQDPRNPGKYPGKYVMANINDSDIDDIPDFADGYNLDGAAGTKDDVNTEEKFVPIVLELSRAFDLATSRLKFTYSASSPSAVSVQGQPPEIQYAASAGQLRIWTKSGSASRNPVTVAGTPAGDFIPSDVELTPAQLGIADPERTKTLYVEGVDASQAIADQRIVVEIDPDAGSSQSRKLGFFVRDAVRTTVVKVDLRDTADNNRSIIGGYIAWITDAPQMPQLQVTVRPDLGSTTLPATWSMETEYSDHGRSDQVFVPGGTAEAPLTQAIQESWSIGAAIAGIPDDLRFFGGKATLSLKAGTTFQEELQFRIRGKNPLPADAKSFIGDHAGPPDRWFAYAIAKAESRYNQFNPRSAGPGLYGMPNWGFPDGWGMFQYDSASGHPIEVRHLWNWQENALAGLALLGEKRTEAEAWMNSPVLRQSGRPVGQRPQTFLDTGAFVPVEPPLQVGNCAFADGGAAHPFEDAVTIKAFNGSSSPVGGFSGYYLAWNGPGPNRWEFTSLNGEVPPFDYVARVCAEVEP